MPTHRVGSLFSGFPRRSKLTITRQLTIPLPSLSQSYAVSSLSPLEFGRKLAREPWLHRPTHLRAFRTKGSEEAYLYPPDRYKLDLSFSFRPLLFLLTSFDQSLSCPLRPPRSSSEKIILFLCLFFLPHAFLPHCGAVCLLQNAPTQRKKKLIYFVHRRETTTEMKKYR